mgnify:CR=1 FL=1
MTRVDYQAMRQERKKKKEFYETIFALGTGAFMGACMITLLLMAIVRYARVLEGLQSLFFFSGRNKNIF